MTPTQIRDNLWVGGAEPAADRAWLNAHCITHVLNVANEVENPDLMIPITKVPLLDGTGNQQIAVDAAVNILGMLLDRGCAVYLHCRAGQSRSPYICARALAVKENSDFHTIYAEIRGLRPTCAFPSQMRILYGPN